MNVATEVELIGLVLSLGLAELAGRRALMFCEQKLDKVAHLSPQGR